jgi:predicted GIY-YIG superfamily endonuclease
VIVDLPDKERLSNFDPIEIFVAPTGLKYLDFVVTTKDDLVRRGWVRTMLDAAPSYERSVQGYGLKAKRRQYGIKHHIVSTIHSAIGLTIGKLATELSSKRKGYNLWERGQLVVLMSRTRRLSDIIFVGDKAENLECLRNAMKLRSQFDDYMEQILSVVSGLENTPNVIRQEIHPFRPKDVDVPPPGQGVVYVLVSCKDRRTTYIGQTNNLKRRIREHNSGYGSSGTCSPELRPWGLLAFVTGFENGVIERVSFEARWKIRRDTRLWTNRLMYTPNSVVTWGSEVVAEFNINSAGLFSLVMVIAGSV